MIGRTIEGEGNAQEEDQESCAEQQDEKIHHLDKLKA
jgi:hypothetical protein